MSKKKTKVSGPRKPESYTKIVVQGHYRQSTQETFKNIELSEAIQKFQEDGWVAESFEVIDVVEGVERRRRSDSIAAVCDGCKQPITDPDDVSIGEFWQDNVRTTLCPSCMGGGKDDEDDEVLGEGSNFDD